MISDTMDQESLLLVDDLIGKRARGENQTPVIAYPKSEKGLLDFEFLTPNKLDLCVDAAVQTLLGRGVMPIGDEKEDKIIGLLGPSNLEFMITMLAWSRLGYGVFILSPRLGIDAYDSLLETVGCDLVCIAPASEPIVTKINQRRELSIFRMLEKEDFQSPDPGSYLGFELNVDKEKKHCKVAYIMHSSGSTGLPKPIYQTNQACLENYKIGHGLDTFLTVPLYHTHGHACMFRSIYSCRTTYFFNANHPPISSSLVSVVEAIKPAAINAVPYTLKLLAETERGVEAMRGCRLVLSTGSATSDDLGDRLVSRGVHLVSLLGSTETGGIMNSMRPFEDKDWSYMSIVPSARPHVWMKPLSESTYELVALEGLKSRVTSNSNNPLNSFYTRDIFIAHPTKENRWKYIGRIDDRVTLSNGEKVLPLPIEGRLREERLLREAVVFGIDRPFPGILLFRSEHAASMDDETFVASMWPAIQEANARAEAFSQIMKSAVVPLGSLIDYPRTDKGTFIRAQVYRKFAKSIQDVYDRLDNETEGSLRLSQPDLESFILSTFQEHSGLELPSAEADFFENGLDSLQAIKISRVLRHELDLGGSGGHLGADRIFEKSNTKLLAKYLLKLQSGDDFMDKDDSLDLMFNLVRKYSLFNNQGLSGNTDEALSSVLITGATGSLGAHLISNLCSNPGLGPRIYCLIRASSAEQAQIRLSASMARWGIVIPQQIEQDRITCLAADLSQGDLGLTFDMIQELRRTVRVIIHSAWSVNFNLGLRSFEQHHIRGTYNLLNLALSVYGSKPARFLFCSSVSVASRASRTETLPETLLTDFRLAGDMGYAQSKMVAEHVVNNAAGLTGLSAHVLRIGQIVGSKQSGIWNDSELIPLIVRSSLTLGVLPKLEEPCSWLPVDLVAQIVIDIGQIAEPTSPARGEVMETKEAAYFYNIVNPYRFSWTEDFLPALRESGLKFESVSTDTWLDILQKTDHDPLKNPVIKLLPLLNRKYGKPGKYNDRTRGSEEVVSFVTQEAENASPTIRGAPNTVNLENVKRTVHHWMAKWQKEDNNGS